MLCGIVVDPKERSEHRRFLATLLWSTAATKGVCLSMVKLVSSSANTNVLAQHISLWGDRKCICPAELNLFLRVFASGTLEEQRTAVQRLSFIRSRPARRVLIDILNDTAAPLEVRECATEMLHLHANRETAEACAKALDDEVASIRFWAAYTLGQIPVFRKSLRELALDDTAVALGWWSVGREAQAMIANLRGNGDKERLQAEIHSVRQDPSASAGNHRWAECYGL